MDKFFYKEVFMPEGQCARCGELTPVAYYEYSTPTAEVFKLGFCSLECKKRFENGMAAIKKTTIFTTQH